MIQQNEYALQDYALGDFDPQILRYQQSEVPEIIEGEVLAKTLYLSLDPTNRVWLSPVDSYLPKIELGCPMRGFVLSRVLESKADGYQKGDLVYGVGTWQEYCALNAAVINKVNPIDGIEMDQYANLFSMIGATSYWGMIELGQAKAGDTVLVSGAAGATGALACQMAKIKGSKVVGIAGGVEKCQYLLDIGCDVAIDYKAGSLSEQLTKTCPEGINLFFDNVGGEMLDMIIGEHMALHSTVIMCGAISQYGDPTNPDSVHPLKHILTACLKRIRLQGFVVLDHTDRYEEIFAQLALWYKAGKIKPRSHILDGLKEAPRALEMILKGENQGKMMVKVSEE